MGKKTTDPKQRTAGPVRHNTMDVDMSWLIRSEPPPAQAAKQPPPVLAAPRRHKTMEVEMDWLEDSAASKRQAPPAIPPGTAAQPKGRLAPPLAREEPISDPGIAVASPSGERTPAKARGPSNPPARRPKHRR